jgi:hypothetical protein
MILAQIEEKPTIIRMAHGFKIAMIKIRMPKVVGSHVIEEVKALRSFGFKEGVVGVYKVAAIQPE